MKMRMAIFMLLILLIGQSFAIVTGQALVDAAREWIGWPYIWGDPPNRTYFGQKGFDGLYWYGTLFDMENWHAGFDCSGLVSYCAELRRHYAADMDNLFGAGRPYWEVAEPGDIIRLPGHFRILSINKVDSAKVYFIHAPGAGQTVKEGSKEYWELIRDNEHAYIFMDDHTGPEIIVTGVEDGGVYSPPVSFNYLVNDPNEWARDVFHEGNYLKETKLTETGDYTLRIFAKDWAMNESNKAIHFKIVGPPQVISTDPSDGASEVDVYKNITITFNKEMNPATVNSGTVQFTPALTGGFTPTWSDDGKTVTLTLNDPQHDLWFYTNYTITITDGVMDKEGVKLDGEKDGKSEGSPEDSSIGIGDKFCIICGNLTGSIRC